MAAIYLRTTKAPIQDQVIDTYYNANLGRQDDSEQLARSILARLLELEAAHGLPLFIFTAWSLLEAGPDVYKPQQYFPAETWTQQKSKNKIPAATNPVQDVQQESSAGSSQDVIQQLV